MANNKHNITLYSYALSPFALKVQSYLLYKRADFNTFFVDPLKVRKQLPLGTMIPVLSCGAESRNESRDIGLWLDELLPDYPLLNVGDREEILQADDWVTSRLIPASFRHSLGIGDSLVILIKKRWYLSEVLKRTVPGGISLLFRLLHLLLVQKAPFLQKAIASTDITKSNKEWCEVIAGEFIELLGNGPFLQGRANPSMADLSAFAQIVRPCLLEHEDYFLPGKEIAEWAERMKVAMPNYRELVPEAILDPRQI